ncbi:flavodoxin family protein [Nocardioides iriomotensis]|uniref:Flavodoxin family protein n=1 Tax=Nocardioides iriomotensis TaxID=715784 RepID=A0A4Q5J227_9ACTN|nr:flavodoxin domain-containing protein [Nocardioides iriomotensis]RYU11499.1 flavodoxin family protein [Nocardioides iriomotensis]
MKALVVYESMWGNTRQVAEAVAEGLGGVPMVEVHDAAGTDLAELDLLVVGGPTHALSMTRPKTRHDALEQGATSGAEDRGIREWLAELPADLRAPVATFDTRAKQARHLPGSAAKSAGKELRKHHHGRVLASASFYVEGTEGPLSEGELTRARAWATDLAAHVVPAS